MTNHAQHSEEPRRRLQQMSAELGVDVTEEPNEADLTAEAETLQAEGGQGPGEAGVGGDESALVAEGGIDEGATSAGARHRLLLSLVSLLYMCPRQRLWGGKLWT